MESEKSSKSVKLSDGVLLI